MATVKQAKAPEQAPIYSLNLLGSISEIGRSDRGKLSIRTLIQNETHSYKRQSLKNEVKWAEVLIDQAVLREMYI